MSTRALDERGSIPIALLAIIALSAVLGALVVSVVGSARAARFDQQYAEVIQSADTGAQAGAQHLIRAVSVDELSTASTYTGSGSLDGIPYTWTATKLTGTSWQVTSTAQDRGVDRTVNIELTGASRFQFGAFSDSTMTFTGSNRSRSYGGTDINGASPGTGKGIIASNGYVRINGGSSQVDGVHLYDWGRNADYNRCRHSGGTGCVAVLTNPVAVAPSARIHDPLEIGPQKDLDTQFIADQLPLCSPAPANWAASTHASAGFIGTEGTTTTICTATATFDRNVEVRGNVRFYVYGDLRFSNGVQINCVNPTCPDEPGTAASQMPTSSRLQFFVSGTSIDNRATTVGIGVNTRIAAGIYAPQSTCGGNPSNAQARIYGSLVCRTITNQGGWNFFYDERLGDASIVNFDMRRWAEE